MQLALSRSVLEELRIKLTTDLEAPSAFDTESSGPSLVGLTGKKSRLNIYRSTMTGFSLAFMDGSSYYVPVRHCVDKNVPMATALGLLRLLLQRHGDIFIANLKHELKVLGLEGFTHKELFDAPFRCTQVLMWFLQKPALGPQPKDPKKQRKISFGLKQLVKYHFDHDMTPFEELVKGRTIDQLDPEDVATLTYTCEDAIYALKLGVTFEPELDIQQRETYVDVEMVLVHVLRYLEDCGFAIDADNLTKLRDELAEHVKRIDDELDFIMPGVNINSDAQLRKWGFDSGRWPTKDADGLPLPFERTEKTKEVSLKAETFELLQGIVDPKSEGGIAISLLLERGELGKMLSTYTDSLIDKAAQYPDRRLHSDYLHTGTRTGRLSSTYPNLQNIPVRTKLGMRIREAFVAAQGNTLFSADYSQIELRVLAHLCGGKGLIADAYIEKRDLHQQTANLVGCSRGQGKTVNFAIIYGAQGPKLAKTISCTLDEAEKFMAGHQKAYPEPYALKEQLVEVVTRRGYVKSLLGGRRYIPELRSQSRGMRWYGGRIAFNFPVQRGARDIMTLGMNAFYKRILDAGMIGTVKLTAQVHDDMICEAPLDIAPEWAKILQECLENAYPALRVPLVAEPVIGTPWARHKD